MIKDEDLLYHFPYWIEKQNSLRRWLYDNNGYYDLVLGRHDIKYENGKEVHFRHDGHFTEKEKSDNYLKFVNFIRWSDWYKGGQNIFSFSKELLEMLNHTDVGEISIDSIKLPFPIFYISFKSLNIKLDNITNEIVEGVYISDNPHLADGHRRLEFQFAGSFEETYRMHNKLDLPHVRDGDFWNFCVDFDERRKIKTIKDSLQDEIDFWKTEMFLVDEDGNPTDQISDDRRDFYNKKVHFSNSIIRLVINCLLYLSLPKEQKDIKAEFPHGLPHNFNKKLNFAKTKKEVDSIIGKIQASGFSRINYVGNSYQRSKTLSNTTGAFLSAHWRRGHWRNQPYSQGLSQKKLIWIQPTVDRIQCKRNYIQCRWELH